MMHPHRIQQRAFTLSNMGKPFGVEMGTSRIVKTPELSGGHFGHVGIGSIISTSVHIIGYKAGANK
jgi:hypothetical protein